MRPNFFSYSCTFFLTFQKTQKTENRKEKNDITEKNLLTGETQNVIKHASNDGMESCSMD